MIDWLNLGNKHIIISNIFKATNLSEHWANISALKPSAFKIYSAPIKHSNFKLDLFQKNGRIIVSHFVRIWFKMLPKADTYCQVTWLPWIWCLYQFHETWHWLKQDIDIDIMSVTMLESHDKKASSTEGGRAKKG